MNNLTDKTIMRQIIMDHYQNPQNQGFKHEGTEALTRRENSPSCIDDITVEVLIENHKIKDINFKGVACTVSTASTDIIASLLVGKTLPQSQEIIHHYHQMLVGKDFNEELIGELLVFANTYKHPNRVNCAKIGTTSISNILQGQLESK